MRRLHLPRRAEIAVWGILLALIGSFLGWRIATNDDVTLHPEDAANSFDSRATVGATFAAGQYDGPAPGRSVAVRVPTGTEHLTVRVRGSISGHRPPAGGEFVNVESVLDTSTTTVPVDGLTDAELEPTVTVLADGRRYPLSGTDDDQAADTVAVAGHPSAFALDVTFQGVTQRVDVATDRRSRLGRAAPLYRTIASGRSSCGTPRIAAPFMISNAAYGSTCTVGWRRVPYMTGEGWAPAGRSWLIAEVATSGPGELLRHGQRYTVDAFGAGFAATCGDGSKPAYVGGETGDDRVRDDSNFVVCRSTGAPQPLHLTESLSAYRVGSTTIEHVTASWSPRLG